MKALMLAMTVLMLLSPLALAKPIVPDVGDLCDSTVCDECPIDGSCDLPVPRAGLPPLPCVGPYACQLLP